MGQFWFSEVQIKKVGWSYFCYTTLKNPIKTRTRILILVCRYACPILRIRIIRMFLNSMKESFSAQHYSIWRRTWVNLLQIQEMTHSGRMVWVNFQGHFKFGLRSEKLFLFRMDASQADISLNVVRV